ncbi:MAG: glycosyltransferase family 2 protein [Methanosarcinaceae archaeon]|nr:glycosyltransferase family 2 protein [Methanosarcinaceae archaeon]
MPSPKVSIIILNWNGKEDTLNCLASLMRISYPNYSLILVDNGSTDGSAELFKNRYPGLKLLENGKNLGFSEGNNVGISKALEENPDYILLLNNDTLVAPNFLEELVALAEKAPEYGIVGPVVLHSEKPDKIQSAGLKVSLSTGEYKFINSNKRLGESFQKAYEVDYVVGCALLAKSHLFEEVGFLNKAYFAYWEEADWCFRARNRGYKVLCVPASKIWHKGGATSKKRSGFTEFHLGRNMFWFLKAHATKRQYFLFLLYFFGFKIWLSAFVKISRKNLPGLKAYLKGVKKGFFTFP